MARRKTRNAGFSGAALLLCVWISVASFPAEAAAAYPQAYYRADCLSLSRGVSISGHPIRIERVPGYGTTGTIGGGLFSSYSYDYSGGLTQWIWFQVWAGWTDSSGTHWNRGRWVTAENLLGDANQLYWVEDEYGRWQQGTTTGAIFGYGGGSGSGGYDMYSVAPVPGPGRYRVYVEIYWSPIKDKYGNVLWSAPVEWIDRGVYTC